MPFFVPQAYLDHLHRDGDRLRHRVAELERQVDTLHAQGLRVTPAPTPAPPPPPAELPELVREVLDGFDDPQARDEYEARARLRLAAGESPDRVAANLLEDV